MGNNNNNRPNRQQKQERQRENEAIKEQKEALFNLRFQHSINQLENPMKIVETKKTIARMLTVLREKQLAENA